MHIIFLSGKIYGMDYEKESAHESLKTTPFMLYCEHMNNALFNEQMAKGYLADFPEIDTLVDAVRNDEHGHWCSIFTEMRSSENYWMHWAYPIYITTRNSIQKT